MIFDSLNTRLSGIACESSAIGGTFDPAALHDKLAGPFTKGLIDLLFLFNHLKSGPFFVSRPNSDKIFSVVPILNICPDGPTESPDKGWSEGT
jgi:hypothetical protein